MIEPATNGAGIAHNSSPSGQTILLLGGADTGKTTLLVQLYGRIISGNSHLKPRGTAASLTAIEHAYRRLQQGLAVEHTAHGTDVVQVLPGTDRAGGDLDVVVSDYAGEDLRRTIDDRNISPRWREQASTSDHWVLLIRLAKHPQLHDILTRPIGELAWRAVQTPADIGPDALPVDMWAVELLQALLYARSVEGAKDRSQSPT
jgi:hypothetical protein